MTVYVVTIDFDVNDVGMELGCPVFDPVHADRERAERRKSEIMSGIGLSRYVDIAFRTYQSRKDDEDGFMYYFQAEVTPFQL